MDTVKATTSIAAFLTSALLLAEVWVSNLDAGFVKPEQKVRLKLVAFPFQRYGMVDGVVKHISADASDKPDTANGSKPQSGESALNFRALVALQSQSLGTGGEVLKLTPGMQVSAELVLGTRTVLEYLLSPIQKVAHEGGRE